MEETWGKLKEDWFRKKGLEERKIQDRMELLIKIKEWIQRLNKISEDDDGIAEDWCKQKYEGKELTEKADKNWCAFILKNLWKMHTIVSLEEKEEINKKIRAYVYCTIMKVWFFSFKQKYCEADRVMEHAFGGMKTLCLDLSRGKECYKCEYGQIENIDVGGVDALKYIWGIFMKNEHAVGRMYSKLPTNSCKQVKNVGTAEIQELPDFIHPPPPPTRLPTTTTTQVRQRTPQSRPGQTVPKTAPSNGEEIWKKVHEQWFQKIRRYPHLKDVINDHMWGRMQEIFINLMSTLPGEEDGIRHLCNEGMDENNEPITPWNNPEKELCRNMMSVMLYTNGLTQNLTVRDKVKGEDVVDTYLRCLVGNAVLVELYGSNCRFNKVLPYASGIVAGTVTQLHGNNMTDDVCSAFNRQDAQIGGKLISKTISDWINDGKWKDQKKVRNYNAIETQGKNCTQDATNGKGRKETKGSQEENKEKKDIEEKVSEIKKIMADKNYLSREGANQVMEKMDPNDTESEMKKKLESKIEEQVQEEKKAAAAPSKAAVAATVKSPASEQPPQAAASAAPTPPPQSQASSPVTPSNDQVTPVVTDQCPSEPSPEVEQKRTKLREAWDAKKKEWTQNGGTLDQDNVKEEVKKMMDELKGYMEMSDAAPANIAHICGSINHTNPNWKRQMKDICKNIVKIIYWMEGWDKGKNRWGRKNGKKEEWVPYLECIIGHTIILEILKEKCNMDQVMSIISGAMEGKGNKFPSGKNGIECDWVKEEDIKSGNDLFGTQVHEWLEVAKKKDGGVYAVEQIMTWMNCKGEEKEQEEKKQNGDCRNARIVDLLGKGRSKELRKLVNTDPPASASASASAPAPKKVDKSTVVDCENREADADADPSACLNLDGDDIPPTEPSTAPSNEYQEATGTTGPKGAAGSKPATVDVAEDKTQLSSTPNLNNSGSQSPNTSGTDTQNPSISSSSKAEQATASAPAVNGVQTAKPSAADSQQPPGAAGPPGSHSDGGGSVGSNSQRDTSPTTTAHPGSGSQQSQPPPTRETTTTASSGVPTTKTEGRGRGNGGGNAPSALPVSNPINPSDFTPYLPTIPVIIGTSVISYLLWKYFALPGKRKRYRRAHQVRRPSILQEQLLAHVDDQDDGPHEYTLVKERKQPRSAPTKRRKRERLDRRVGRRMIIDIHLEVLDECQKGDNKLNQEDFFEILVQEFMAREFMNEENVPKEDVPKEKDVQSLDSGFREEDFVPKEGIPQEQVPSSDSGFREENLVPKEDFTRKDVHKEQVPSSDCGCREEDFLCKKNVPNKGVPCSDSGFGF